MSICRTDRPRSIVITGASTGIGAACALDLDQRGFRVFAGVRKEADAQRLRQQASERMVPLMLDVTDAEAIAAAVETVAADVGPAGLFGLINNAGIVVPGPLELVPIDKLRMQMEVNVLGQIAMIQAFLPLLRAARGRIINMSSISGRVAAPYLGPYCGSKFALEAFSDALRLELRNWGIKVVLVEPGSVATPIWQKSREAADEASGQINADAVALYEADLDALRRVTQKIADNAMPVEKVLRAVRHALYARRPRTRYPVGTEARLTYRFLRFLPDRLRDRVIRRGIGLP